MFGVVAMVSLLVVACGAGGDETLTFTFEVGDSPTLLVGTGRGDVLVQTGPDGVITVRSEVTAKDNVALDVTADGDVVTARSVTTVSGNLFGDTAEGSVDFTFTVPPETVIEVGAGDGAVSIEDVQVGGKVSSSQGTVTLSRVSGDFLGGSGTGDVTITKSSGSFQFTVGVGAIRFDGKLSARGASEFVTGIGDVIVSIPETMGLDITAEALTGIVLSDLTLMDEVSTSTANGEHLSGILGDGSAKLSIAVGTGTADIRGR